MTKRNILFPAILMLFIFSLLTAQEKHYSPEEVIEKLMLSNTEFAENLSENETTFEAIKNTSHGQHPYAIILTCADSRVIPEIIFNKTIGELFVIRVAGNIIDESTLGSIEYAAEHLHSPYFLVLGHTHCGAVHVAVDDGSSSPSINSILEVIAPAVTASKPEPYSKEQHIELAVKENVLLQMNNALSQSEILQHLVADEKIKFGGAIYDISTGKVEFIK